MQRSEGAVLLDAGDHRAVDEHRVGEPLPAVDDAVADADGLQVARQLPDRLEHLADSRVVAAVRHRPLVVVPAGALHRDDGIRGRKTLGKAR